MKLVDLEKLLYDVQKTVEESNQCNHEREIIDCIKHTDYIDIVCCNECKYHRDVSFANQKLYLENVVICTCDGKSKWNDDYCSYGKRKDNVE